jgi:hypothetical protein
MRKLQNEWSFQKNEKKIESGMNIWDALIFLLWHFLTLEFVLKESFQDTSHLIERMTIDGMFNLTHIDMVKGWKRNPLNGVNIFTLYLDIRK